MFEEEVLSENLSTVNWSGPPNPQIHSDDEEDFLSFSRWDKGAFNNYVNRILSFDDPRGPLRGQFLYPERGQKQTFFDKINKKINIFFEKINKKIN